MGSPSPAGGEIQSQRKSLLSQCCLSVRMSSPWSLVSLFLLVHVALVVSQPRKAREMEEEEAVTMAVTLPFSTTEFTTDSGDTMLTKDGKVETDKDNEVVTSDEKESTEDEETLENLEQCHKCRKPSFKYKKEFYCLRCVREGAVEEEEEEKDHCNKCQRPRYRSRHGDFCEEECPDTDKKDVEKDEELDDNETDAKVENKNKKVKNTGMKDKDMEEDTTETNSTPSLTETESDSKPEVGFLGNLLATLVKATTWGADGVATQYPILTDTKEGSGVSED